MSLADDAILALAHRSCAKYICQSKGGESFSFNEFTMVQFARKLEERLKKELDHG